MGRFYRQHERASLEMFRKLGWICVGLVTVEVPLIVAAVLVDHTGFFVAACVVGGITGMAAFTWGVMWLIHHG